MFDARLRNLVGPVLDAAARRLAAAGIGANAITFGGLATGLLAAGAVALRHDGLALACLALSRLLDGLDGPVARATAPTDRGGYLDIVSDYVFYAAMPLGFACADPARNALPAAALLASFSLTGASFLAYAALAARRQAATPTRQPRSLVYSFGIMEGGETIAFLVAMVLFPQRFAVLAWAFAALCVLTVLQRSLAAMQAFD